MTIRASLAPVAESRPPGPAPLALLDPSGARCIVGSQAGLMPIAPSATTLFAPRGASLTAPDGPLVVCDTGHHRLLIWRGIPAQDHAPADIVIGQCGFVSEGRNGNAAVGASTLNVPTGICFGDGVLAVADAWNHRVLIWHRIPDRDNCPADIVLGQQDFCSALPNRGRDGPDADTLNWCYGAMIHRGRLLVADSGNRRVLIWNQLPQTNGAPADIVLGQQHFGSRDENAGDAPGPVGMRWPHGLAVWDDALIVADAGNHRVMLWHSLPKQSGTPCDLVLGQSGFFGCDNNRGAYHPSASGMSMPYAAAVAADSLVVADTANSRLLGFQLAGVRSGVPARSLAGQSAFDERGENRWAAPARDSLCWPYGVSACGTTLVIADSGNNRVLLWDAA